MEADEIDDAETDVENETDSVDDCCQEEPLVPDGRLVEVGGRPQAGRPQL